MTSEVRKTRSGRSDQELDFPDGLRLVGSVQDSVQMDRAARGDGRKGVREEFEGGMGQVEDDSVDGGNLL